MIHVVIGTKAQLIKMAPLLAYFKRHGMPYHYISTGQHKATIDEILANFDLRAPDTLLYNGPDITSIKQMAVWGAKLLWRTFWHSREVFPGDRTKSIVLVHGDTFSTLLGALMGKFAGLKVGHVESGLRSFNWFHPFPEEITRLLTFKLSDYFFCPGEWAVNNLVKEKGHKINTINNTLYESLQAALSVIERITDVEIPLHTYAVVTLHRYENVYKVEALSRIVNLIEQIATSCPLLFILHKPTEINLKKFGFYQRLVDNSRIELRPRYDYFRFIKLLHGAHFVVSDGGSNQEECYYLGKPVILLRQSTERKEGIGKNCVLSCYDPQVIDEFLNHVDDYRYTFKPQTESPCQIIAGQCLQFATKINDDKV
ncbi:UDP-N-acetylglucosamine 2-epimerase [Candidatus Electronema sp. JC]|uniref:UDP-N-acetylglucosamine 2-epimerase n=1 Tax=Candidatus Electronema sp. JC TaxID=3401570 RepID=UPI003B43A775